MTKVICFGTFDILHEGHTRFLEDAKKQGDYLDVIIISNKAVFENKGKYPINSQEKRIENLGKLKIADKIIKVSDDLGSNLGLISSINPDVIVFGYDQQTNFEKRLKDFLDSNGLKPEYYISKEFAGGIHSKNLID